MKYKLKKKLQAYVWHLNDNVIVNLHPFKVYPKNKNTMQVCFTECRERNPFLLTFNPVNHNIDNLAKGTHFNNNMYIQQLQLLFSIS